MEILRKIINKHMPLSLGSLLAFVVMVNITSCECGKGPKEANKLEINVDKENLKGDADRVVKVTVKPSEEDVDKKNQATLVKYKMKVKVNQTGGTPKVGEVSFKSYADDRTETTTTIKDGDTVEAKSLSYFFKGGDQASISNEELEAEFTFDPKDADKIELVFEIVNAEDENGTPVATKTVTWEKEAVPAPVYKLELEELEADGFVKGTNKFTVKVAKVDGTAIMAGEAKDLKVDITVTGDATVNGGNAVNFVDGDIKVDVLSKELEITPGATESELKLQLKHNGNNIGIAQVAKVKHVVPAGTYTLAVDKDDIKDGATKITVTVAIAGGADLKKEDLEHLSLKIERGAGAHATIQDATAIAGKPAESTYAFTAGANELQVAADKTSATKELTIVPGVDKAAEFKITLLDKENKPVAGAESTIKWEDGVALQVVKIDYIVAAPTFAYEIKNNSNAAEVDDIQLSWERKEGSTATVNTSEKGNINIKIDDLSKLKAGDLAVDWGATDATAKFEFTVTHKGQEVYKQLHTISKAAPKVKLALKNAGKSQFTGEAEKAVVFIVTAGEDLSEAALKATKLGYTVVKGRLMFDGKDAQDLTLEDLLKVTSLTNTNTKEFTLTIDNQNHSTAEFSDIKIKCSENESEVANKVEKIEWEGEIKVQVQGKTNLAQLKGDAGKTVSLTVTNTSGFNLVQADLEKVVINLKNLTAGASVKYGANNIQSGTTTLWAVLATNLDAGQKADKDLTIETVTNSKVEFTLGLAGTNKETTNHAVNVTWEGDVKVKIEGHDGTVAINLAQLKGIVGKTIPVRITNESGFDLTTADLEKVTITLKDRSDNAIQITNLADELLTNVGELLNKGLNAGDHEEVKLKLVTGTKSEASIKIELDGVNKGTAKVVEVKWEEGIKVQVDGHDGTDVVDLKGLKGDSGKVVPVRFSNTSGFDLVEEELRKVTIELADLTTGASVNYHDGTTDVEIEGGTTTLWDVLGAELKASTPQVKNLAIDDGGKESVEFKLTLAGSNKEASNVVEVAWKKEDKKATYKVKIVDAGTLAELVGNSNKTVKLAFENETGAELDVAALSNIKIGFSVADSKDGTLKAVLSDGNELEIKSDGSTTLAEVLENKSLVINGKAEVVFELEFGDNKKRDVTIKLTGSDSAEIEKKIEWRLNP